MVLTGLLWLWLAAAALAAGLFYAFSFAVMPGLAAVAPAVAIAAMRSINARILQPLFLFVFFGPLVLPAAALVTAFLADQRQVALIAAGAAVTYGLGVVAVTFRQNIPLNEALAALGEQPAEPDRAWRGFADPWLMWNHLRMVAALAACILAAVAIARAP